MGEQAEHTDLYHKVQAAGWTIGSTSITSYGVMLVFRKWPYTSDFPDLETKTAHGKDRNDAIREFLKKLEEE